MRRGRGTEGFQVIRVYDPAIDYEDMPQEAYNLWMETRDTALIEPYITPGLEPVRFFCRLLTSGAEERDVGLRGDNADAFERAFSLCIRKVEHLPYRNDEGSRLWTRPHDGAKARPLGDTHLAEFSRDDVVHVGQVITRLSFCSPDRQLYVPLLASCLDAVRAQGLAAHRRRAAATSDTSRSEGNKPQAAEPSPAAPSP